MQNNPEQSRQDYPQSPSSYPYPQPQPFITQPPVQPPPRLPWYRRIRKRTWMTIIAIFLLIGIVNAIATGGQGVGNTAQATPTSAVQPTSQPTSIITPTTKPTQSTPTVHPSGGIAPVAGPALLGSDIGTFVAAFGQPNAHSDSFVGQYHFQTYPGENVDSLILLTDVADGGTYANRVESISVQAPSSGWTVTQADQHCEAFYPRDAVYKNRVVVAPPANAYDKIYFSNSLASLFPASAFTDAQQNTVKAGYFDVQYLYTDASDTAIDSCSIIIGEEQTS